VPKTDTKPKIIPDKDGFLIGPALASAYREIRRELTHLVNGRTRKIPAIAERIKELEARAAAIKRRFQAPCPAKYGPKEAAKDLDRLTEFAEFRGDGIALTEVQKAEEAHLWARRDVFNANRTPPAPAGSTQAGCREGALGVGGGEDLRA
jgi:hypothetical protein